MNITELFLTAASKYPSKLAIVEAKHSITFSELENNVLATAAYFKSKGIVQGDRVLVFVPMGIDLYRIVLALFYVGAVAVFLDEWVGKKRLEECCKHAKCQGFIAVFKARVFAFFSKEIRKIPIKLQLGNRLYSDVAMAHVTPNSTALITFTTGSTGIPKAANRTHEFLQEQFKALLEEIDPHDTDVDMPVLPIVLFVNLGVGCTSVIAHKATNKPKSINAAVIVNQIRVNSVNRITASPFFINKISCHLIENHTTLPTVKKIFTGGAPVFPSEASLYTNAFPKSECKVVYGSTEAEPISSINCRELIARSIEKDHGLPVGRLYHKINLKIIKISDREIDSCSAEQLKNLEVKSGKIGEIIVSGPHVLKQYFNNEEALRKSKIITNDTVWHRTGDSGFKIGNELFLTGRCHQLIRNEEGYVSPFIIESQLQNIAHARSGTILNLEGKNILVIESSLNVEQLQRYVSEIPHDEMIVIDRMPRDPRHNSKIDYYRLRKMLAVSNHYKVLLQ